MASTMRSKRSIAGFTLVELLVASGVFGAVTLALLAFMSTSVRLIIRNLATNHSHETARISSQRMLNDLHDASSRFQLISLSGTTYTDVTPSVTGIWSPFPAITSARAPTECASSGLLAVRFRSLHRATSRTET